MTLLHCKVFNTSRRHQILLSASGNDILHRIWENTNTDCENYVEGENATTYKTMNIGDKRHRGGSLFESP